MCYSASQTVKSAQRYLKELKDFGGDPDHIREVEEDLERLEEEWDRIYKPQFYGDAFAHPKLITATKNGLELPYWGLIPHWTKTEEDAKKLWNRTLNARGETVSEKPSFRTAAKYGRCIIPLDGFYEYYHENGKTYPFLVQKQDKPLLVGGILSRWVNKETGEEVPTVSIVTTAANPLMKVIHNNPKVKQSRMPLILDVPKAMEWMFSEDTAALQELIKPADIDLDAHPVQKLKGRNAVGNSPEALEPMQYPEMELELE